MVSGKIYLPLSSAACILPYSICESNWSDCFDFQLQEYAACYTQGSSSIYDNEKRDSNGSNLSQCKGCYGRATVLCLTKLKIKTVSLTRSAHLVTFLYLLSSAGFPDGSKAILVRYTKEENTMEGFH